MNIVYRGTLLATLLACSSSSGLVLATDELKQQNDHSSPASSPAKSPSLQLRHDQQQHIDRRLEGDGRGFARRLTEVLFHGMPHHQSGHRGLRAHELDFGDDRSLKKKKKSEDILNPPDDPDSPSDSILVPSKERPALPQNVKVCHWGGGKSEKERGGKWVIIEIKQSALDAHLRNHEGTSEYKDCLCSDDNCFCAEPVALFGKKECSGICSNNPICGEHGTCKPTVSGGVECECHAGYAGIPCLDIDECEEEIDECHANAFCTNIGGGFTCTCKEGFVAADGMAVGGEDMVCICPDPWKEFQGACICPCSSEDDDCNLGACDLLTGLCTKKPTKEGVICYDGNPCYQNNFCTNGKCGGGIPKDCSFLDDVCNKGVCNILTGACEAHPTGTICELVNNGGEKENNLMLVLDKVSKPYDIEADINGDGIVDIYDAIALIAYLNETHGPESLSPPIPPDLFDQFAKIGGLGWLNFSLASDHNSRNLDSARSMNSTVNDMALQHGFAKGRGLLPFQCGNDVDEDGMYTKLKPGESVGEPPNRGFDDHINAGNPYDPSASPTWLDKLWWKRLGQVLNLETTKQLIPDAVEKNLHFRSAAGTQQGVDYDKALREMKEIRGNVMTKINTLSLSLQQLHDGTETSFQFYQSGEAYLGTANFAWSNPSIVDLNWAFTLGGHRFWFTGDVHYSATKCIFIAEVTIHVEDWYNFNKGQVAQFAMIPDDVNARFETLGWAKGFWTRDTTTRERILNANAMQHSRGCCIEDSDCAENLDYCACGRCNRCEEVDGDPDHFCASRDPTRPFCTTTDGCSRCHSAGIGDPNSRCSSLFDSNYVCDTHSGECIPSSPCDYSSNGPFDSVCYTTNPAMPFCLESTCLPCYLVDEEGSIPETGSETGTRRRRLESDEQCSLFLVDDTAGCDISTGECVSPSTELCDPNPCENGGECIPLPGTIECNCEGTGFEGSRCQEDVDECTSISGNGGCQHICTNTVGSFLCTCSPGYDLDEDGFSCSMNDCPADLVPSMSQCEEYPLTCVYLAGGQAPICTYAHIEPGFPCSIGGAEGICDNGKCLTHFCQVGGDIDGEASGIYSGAAVATSGDGSRVAIGARYNTISANGSHIGHVRVFELMHGIWSQLGDDIDGAEDWDSFGAAVALSSSGEFVVVGAPGYDESRGRVQVYRLIGDTWTQVGPNLDGEWKGDKSGDSVTISENGSRIAIGAPFNHNANGKYSGHVRAYELIGNVWIQLGSNILGETAGDLSGRSVSMSRTGSRVAIGAPGPGSVFDGKKGYARVYEYNGGNWVQVGGRIDGEYEGDQSGHSISLSGDGTKIAIGAFRNSGNDGNDHRSGSARVYGLVSGTWTQLGSDIDGEFPNDDLGLSISLSSNGSRLAVGAHHGELEPYKFYDHGYVRVFQLIGDVWAQLGSDIDGDERYQYTGESVSLSSDGSRVAIGAPGDDGNGSQSGNVRVYELMAGGVCL